MIHLSERISDPPLTSPRIDQPTIRRLNTSRITARSRNPSHRVGAPAMAASPSPSSAYWARGKCPLHQVWGQLGLRVTRRRVGRAATTRWGHAPDLPGASTGRHACAPRPPRARQLGGDPRRALHPAALYRTRLAVTRRVRLEHSRHRLGAPLWTLPIFDFIAAHPPYMGRVCGRSRRLTLWARRRRIGSARRSRRAGAPASLLA